MMENSGKILNGIALIVMLAVMAVMPSSCRKWSHNGDLDGQWQVMEVAYSNVPIEFPEGERFYYNFYLHTFQLTTSDERPFNLKGNMTYEGDRLYLDLPFVGENKIPQQWRDRLVYWGVPQSGIMDTRILKLNASSLVLQYGDVVISMRKF